ncbi:hypothetical protein [Winogradskyella sp.]|uniref:hypothetical protein n=1 Tax=Winogradskyella sp. TaxID=1883156 RepID=UPI0025DDBD99|nr:hypothetical protein [Winogradskyella sp.]
MWLLKLKRNDKIGLFFFVAFVLSSSLLWLFEERFNKEQWRSQPATRYKMVDDIIESQLLIDKTKDEVIVILGKPNSTSTTEKDVFAYRLGEQPSFFKSGREQLLVIFVNQKVNEVTLALE